MASMKLLTAKEIKKILLGVVLSDGSIDVKNQRFDFYSKHEGYAKYIFDVVSQISGMVVSFRVKHDKRGFTGYRVFTRKHAYWHNMASYTYHGRKELNAYSVSRIDGEALAHIWMCDGLLSHAKNQKTNKVQNVGWLCYEAFPENELRMLAQHLQLRYGIGSSIIKVRWGFGFRIRFGGLALQALISLVYPYIRQEFLYKTVLYYKSEAYADMNLPNAEHIIKQYVNVEDIVRHSK